MPIAISALLISVVVGIVTGPVAAYAGPFLWFVYDKTIGSIGRRLDSEKRSSRDLFIRGVIYSVIIIVFGLGLGSIAEEVSRISPSRSLVSIIFLSLCLSSGAVWRSLWLLYGIMKKDKKKEGVYLTLANSSGLDLSAMDDFGVTRVAIDYTLRMFPLAVVGPVFWYLIGGFPLACAYTFIAASYWHLGRDGYGGVFGRPVLLLEYIAGIAPSALSSVITLVSCVINPTTSVSKGFNGLVSFKSSIPHAEGGRNSACAAFAMGVAIGGHVTGLDGNVRHRKWIGPDLASAKLDASNVKRVLYLVIVSNIILLAVLAGLMCL